VCSRGGSLHRDLKPANVMITGRSRQDPRLRRGEVLQACFDVGAEKHEGERSSSSGSPSGTVGYMSPEQAARKELDPHRLFAWACAFEMATGELRLRRPGGGFRSPLESASSFA